MTWTLKNEKGGYNNRAKAHFETAYQEGNDYDRENFIKFGFVGI